MTMQIACDDDRHGIATMRSDPRTRTAIEKVRMSDGTESKIKMEEQRISVLN